MKISNHKSIGKYDQQIWKLKLFGKNMDGPLVFDKSLTSTSIVTSFHLTCSHRKWIKSFVDVLHHVAFLFGLVGWYSIFSSKEKEIEFRHFLKTFSFIIGLQYDNSFLFVYKQVACVRQYVIAY